MNDINIDQVPTAVPDTNKACIICRSRNKEDAAECAASLALCKDQPIFVTICAGLCDNDRMMVVQALANAARRTVIPLSLDILPQGDPRAINLKLSEYGFREVLELYLRILQSNGILQNLPMTSDSVEAMRCHILSRQAQERSNERWESMFSAHVGSEVRNARAMLAMYKHRLTPETEGRVKQLWAATWSPE